jgi:hypothetical protein
MRSLVPLQAPGGGYLARFVEIRDSKHNEVRLTLAAIHQEIREQFAHLESSIANGELHLATPEDSCDVAGEALRACYYGSTQALESLKSDIKAAQPTRALQRCPMCGVTIPATFDHYLPTSRFPEFSVHALNLVPCCSTCNSKKGDKWLSSDGHRQFLHVFSDAVPKAAFLSVKLLDNPAHTATGAAFSLVRPRGISTSLWKLIVAHFERLELLKRYGEHVGEELASLLCLCRSFRDADGADTRTFLRSHAARLATAHGRNHWLAVLTFALAQHSTLDDLVDAVEPLAP